MSIGLEGFVISKSDIFTVQKNRIFLCKISSIKDCFCKTKNIIVQSDRLNNSIEHVFTQIQIRRWYSFENLDHSLARDETKIYRWLPDSFISVISEKPGRCNACQLPSRQLVNFEGVITDIDHFNCGIICLDNEVVVYFVGKIGPDFNALVGHTLYCYNVWILDDLNSLGLNYSPLSEKKLLIADVVSSFALDNDETVILSNPQILSTNLYKLAHMYSLSSLEIVSYSNIFWKLEMTFNCTKDNLWFLSKLIRVFHGDRYARQLTTEYLNFNHLSLTRCDSSIMNIINVTDILEMRNFKFEKIATNSSETAVLKICEPFYICAKLCFESEKTCFLLKDSINVLPYVIKNGDWSGFAMKEHIVLIKNCLIVKEHLTSQSTLMYILSDVDDIISPLSQNKTLKLSSQPQTNGNISIVSKSALQFCALKKELFFKCNGKHDDSTLMIEFSLNAAFLYPRLNEGSIYSISGVNDNVIKSKEKITIRDFHAVHFLKLTSDNTTVPIMTVSELVELSPPKFGVFSLWGIAKSKIILSAYSWKVVLEDALTLETIEVYSSHSVSLLYGKFLGDRILITNCENRGVHMMSENSDLRILDRAPPMKISPITFLFHVVTDELSHRFLSSCTIIRICRLSLYIKDDELRGSSIVLIDDGTLEAVVFINKMPHMQKLLNFTNNQMAYLSSVITARRSDFYYYGKHWNSDNSTIIDHKSVDHWITDWLKSIIVLRPVSMLLRVESKTGLHLTLKHLKICNEELIFLKPNLPSLLCLHIDDLSL